MCNTIRTTVQIHQGNRWWARVRAIATSFFSVYILRPHTKLLNTINHDCNSFDPVLEDEYEDLTRDRVSAHGFLDGQITPRTTRGWDLENIMHNSGTILYTELINRTAGATVARSTPDRKVIRSNRVWFNTYSFDWFVFLLPLILLFALHVWLLGSFTNWFWRAVCGV